MIRNYNIKFLASLLAFSVFFAYADLAFAISLGEVSENFLVPVSFLGKFIYILCYMVGGGLIIGSLVLYKTHRDNPTQVRITQPILWLMFGIILILLPIIAQLSTSAPA